jgi:carboxypeptidase family protein
VIRTTRAFSALIFTVALGACADSIGPSAADSMALQLSVVGPAAVSAAEIGALGAAFDRVDQYDIVIVEATTEEVIVDTTIAIVPGGVLHTLDIAVPEIAFGRTVTITLIAFDDGMELYRSTQTVTLGDETGQVNVELQIRYTGPGIRGVVADAQGVPVPGVTVDLEQGQSILEAVLTEDDGSFLFLDVLPGTYRVNPQGDVGRSNCPDFRDVTVLFPDESIVANFLSVNGSCTTDVLVLSGGDFDDTGAVAAALATDAELNVSTFFFVNQMPGVDFLSQHSVVLVFMNGLFNESATLGDELAAYVARGGNVITASFYYQGRSDSGVGSSGWGALEQLDPFTSLVDPLTGVGGATYQSVSLDVGSIVQHPITANLTTLTSTSFSSGVAAKAGVGGTTVLASWDDGAPLVGYRLASGGQRLVGVSLFPSPDATITGDAGVLWNNVVRWASFAPPFQP